MPERFTTEILEKLISTLSEMRDRAVSMEESFADQVQAAAPEHRASARNLLHYLSLRQHDIRPLQRDLTRLGLSSLGRLEANTLAGLDAVLVALHRLADRPFQREPQHVPPVDFYSGPDLLKSHTEALLGPAPADRDARIMVTMPTSAATDAALVRDLVEAGMEVMRINCAHDGVAQWEAMIRNLRDAETATGRSCRVMCDLAGPKLRTGRIEDAPRVIKVRPQRDALGEVVAPAQVWLTPSDAMAPPPYEVDASVPVDRAIAEAASDGDVLRIVDARSKRREIFIVANEGTGCVGELDRTSYIEEDAPLRLHRKKGRNLKGVVGEIPTQAAPILVFPEDTLYLTRSDTPGRLPTRHSDGTLAEPAQLPCTLDDVFADVQAGERILFDDGKIAGVISDARPDQLAVCITHANPRGAKLAADKGINLPDSTLQLPSLTEKDLLDLEFIVQHADMVSLSFVRKPEDVLLLEDHLERLGGERLGIVLKIETKQGFERLPRLLLASLRSPPVGVMVARGDLAVEIGFERLAEVQEEILWLCEAAHVPVIWATQVLENLAKRGAPSRAEVTDAAMSSRAECVMLNKGPHIVEAVRFLAGVLERMAYHQHKKRAMLRKLSISQFA